MSATEAASGTTEANLCACGQERPIYLLSCLKCTREMIARFDAMPSMPKAAPHPLDARLRDLAATWQEASVDSNSYGFSKRMAYGTCARELSALLGDAE